MKINHVSVSRSQCFQQCPQCYKYRYHLELPSLEAEPPYFTYGSLIHKIIEEYTLNKGNKNLGDIRRAVMAGDSDDPDLTKDEIAKLPAEYLKKINNHLLAFLQLTKKIGLDGLCEWSFHYDLDPPNHRCLHGYIDRLIQRDDRFYIVDYKTTKKGKWRKDSRTITDDLQLQCYALIISNEFKVAPEKIKAALYYLDGAELVAAQFSQQTLEDTQKKMLSIYKEIESMEPETVKGNVGEWCRRCDYRKCCPFYSLT